MGLALKKITIRVVTTEFIRPASCMHVHNTAGMHTMRNYINIQREELNQSSFVCRCRVWSQWYMNNCSCLVSCHTVDDSSQDDIHPRLNHHTHITHILMSTSFPWFDITGSTAAQPSVNSHCLSRWEPFIFDPPPPQNRRPLTYC